jgi:hypothetical protein
MDEIRASKAGLSASTAKAEARADKRSYPATL